MKKVSSSNNVFIFANKTRDIHESSPENYHKLILENTTKLCKIGDEELPSDINSEVTNIADNLNIGYYGKETSVHNSIKDHKGNFNSNPKCRLINPSKSELGKVSKIILDNINESLRSKLNVNQWINSASVINWFSSINNKSDHTFLLFDIVEFYPSINEKLLDDVIK